MTAKTLVGIDEAGYGPKLGPLVLAAASFELDDRPRTLRQRLRGIVGRDPSELPRRLPVDDSKRLFAGRRSLAPIEWSVLSFQGSGPCPGDLEQFLGREPPSPPWPRWYRSHEVEELPVAAEPEGLAGWRAALPDKLRARGIHLVRLRPAAVLEGPFNRSLQRTDNKATSLLEFLRPLLVESVERAATDTVEVRVDRLGGRHFYADWLRECFAGAAVETMAESSSRSAYSIRTAQRRIEVSFEVGADARHLPVALASMTAKYVRELFVRRLNAHFAALRPGLRPTAGYPQDATRFLADIDSHLTGGDRGELIRAR